jgi:hypothetical protein
MCPKTSNVKQWHPINNQQSRDHKLAPNLSGGRIMRIFFIRNTDNRQERYYLKKFTFSWVMGWAIAVYLLARMNATAKLSETNVYPLMDVKIDTAQYGNSKLANHSGNRIGTRL